MNGWVLFKTALKKVSLAFPGSLLVMVVTIALTYGLDLENVCRRFLFGWLVVRPSVRLSALKLLSLSVPVD